MIKAEELPDLLLEFCWRARRLLGVLREHFEHGQDAYDAAINAGRFEAADAMFARVQDWACDRALEGATETELMQVRQFLEHFGNQAIWLARMIEIGEAKRYGGWQDGEEYE
jgi:hypothetical protein